MRRGAILIYFAAVALSARAALLDRIAIVVNRQVVTEAELEEELQVTDFLNEVTSKRSLEQRRAAAARLIDQVLLREEMALSRYVEAERQNAGGMLQNLRQAQGESAFADNLRRYHLTSDELLNHLALQAAALSFIEFRFRPQLAISDVDLRTFYPRFAAKWRENHPGAAVPDLNTAEGSVRQALLDERTDQALDEWLKDARRRADIRYLDPELGAQP